MKKLLLSLLTFSLGITTAGAVDANTVEIVFSGNAATVNVASNISSYITNQSSGSHVKLVQSASWQGNSTGEITYILSGTSTNGEFYLEGAYKCSLELKGLTLTNPSGPAINIQNGKRINVTAKSGTTSTLADGPNDDYNGCIHVKGHTEFKGKGTLNVVGNSRHAIYSKEYIEVKNLTLNVTGAVKDGIHCREYFLMESGNVKISAPQDDGIQVEMDGTVSTGITTDHEDEDTGNFYMLAGTLTISGQGSMAIKADGAISYSGGTRNFDSSATQEYAGIEAPTVRLSTAPDAIFDLNGRRLSVMPRRGVCIVRRNGQSRVVMLR